MTSCKRDVEQWLDRIGDYNIEDESAVFSVKDAMNFLKATIVYCVYELAGEEESATLTITQCAEAIDKLVEMDEADAVRLSYHPMGAIMVAKLKEVEE